MSNLKNGTTQALIILMIFLLASCSPAASATGIPVVETDLPVASLPTPTSMPATEETTAAVASPTAGGALENGLWLVLHSEEGVEAVNRESGKIVSLSMDLPLDQPVLMFAAEKAVEAETWFCLLNGQSLTLQVFNLSDGQPQKEIPLLASSALSDEKRAAFRQALLSSDPPAVSWSPDGRQMAFLAAIDHPGLDLYLFDTSDLSISLLSEGTPDVFQPGWSPDGQWIVYDETDGLNTIGLWAISAVRAVRANASETRLLYEPASYAEPRLGWSSAESYIVHSVRDRGPVDLRDVSLSGESRLIFAGAFNHPVYDAGDSLAAFLITDSFTDPALQPPGIYAGSVSRPAKILAPGPWDSLIWDAAAKSFFGIKNQSSAFSISPSGETIAYVEENSLPSVSNQGDVLAFAGGEESGKPGLRLYSNTGNLLSEVTQKAVEDIYGLPDGSLVYREGADLYLLPASTGQPTKLAEKAAFLGWLDTRVNP